VDRGPDQRSWDAVPDPNIQELSEIVVESATATTCGSHTHIFSGEGSTVVDEQRYEVVDGLALRNLYRV
jgi:hypothetical protein